MKTRTQTDGLPKQGAERNVSGRWRQLYNGDLHDFYGSIHYVIKSIFREVKHEENVKMRNEYKNSLRNQKQETFDNLTK
jgi:hypothetical protein